MKKKDPGDRTPDRERSAGGVVIERCTCRRGEGRIEVEIDLFNPGPSSAFAVSGVRRVDYDPERSVLTLWLSDRGGLAHPQGAVRKEFTLPPSRPIEPGSRATLKAGVREDMTRLVPDREGGFHLEQLDLAAAREVRVVVSVADAPFYFNPSQGDVVGQLERWGADLRETAEPVGPRTEGGKKVGRKAR